MAITLLSFFVGEVRAGRLLKLMHLQRCTGTADIGHDCQTVEPWESAARASTIARLAVLHVMAAIASSSAAWIRRGGGVAARVAGAAGERREFITLLGGAVDRLLKIPAEPSPSVP